MWSFQCAFALYWMLICLFRPYVAAIKNPIIPGWNPDPSIIRVGNEYFVATSSFEYFPGVPIYKSTDLANWELYSHVFMRPEQLQLYGTPTGAGVWAPTISHINGRFYIASMTRWTYDPTARVWPRVFWVSSTDLKEWSDPIWSDPWGIDPSLFEDPDSRKVYLNLMSPNNNVDRIWGIYQCEVNLSSGKCIGDYRPLWNGTLPHNSSARPEGPKMFKRNDWYYLLIAEGGTDDLHRATIARSSSPEGPWTPNPNNPLIYNGAYGFDNLTVQSTGHATIIDTPEGDYYAAFLARRKINGSSPLGRETFLCTVEWDSDWPIFNGGKPILLSESFGKAPDQKTPPAPFVDNFDGSKLDPSWYQLRTPYAPIYTLENSHNSPNSSGLVLLPNVFGLSDRDVPAAILRKQRSLNMTFTASLLPINGSLGYGETVGIAAYLSELEHQDIGISGCINATGMCVYTSLIMNQTTQYYQEPLNVTTVDDFSLHIRAEPLMYHLGFSHGSSPVNWLTSISSSWLAFAPPNWFVFEGATFALFATGTGQPWPPSGIEVGFANVRETYYEENIPDHDVWS